LKIYLRFKTIYHGSKKDISLINAVQLIVAMTIIRRGLEFKP